MPAQRPGQMPREEMLAHLQNGRTVLISPVYGKDEAGDFVEKEPGRFVARPEDLPGVLETVVGDPAAIQRARSDAQSRLDSARRELADLEKAEADAKAKEQPPAAATAPATAATVAAPAAAHAPAGAAAPAATAKVPEKK